MRPRLTTKQIDAAAELQARGVAIRIIAARLGVTGPTILRHLRDRGVVPPAQARRSGSTRLRLPQATVDDAVRRYQAGTGIRPIARRCLVSYNTARRLLLEQGVVLRPRGAHSEGGQR